MGRLRPLTVLGRSDACDSIGGSYGIVFVDNLVDSLVLIALGVFTLLNASWRYFHVMRLMVQGQFQPNVVSILAMVTMILLVIVVFVSLTVSLTSCKAHGMNQSIQLCSFQSERNKTPCHESEVAHVLTFRFAAPFA